MTINTDVISIIKAITLAIIFSLNLSFFLTEAAALNNDASYGSSGLENLDDVIYDQRQNGSENLRIHMNDVTLVIAPSEGILQLMGASAADILANNELSTSNNSGKPSSSSGLGATAYSSQQQQQQSDCATDPIAKCKQQSHKKNRLRLSSLIVPLLNRATGNR